MTTRDVRATAAGVLFIVATVAALLSAPLLGSLLDGEGFLSGVAALYYIVFYRFQLIPRWLSGWGLAGTGLGFLAELLVLFEVIRALAGAQPALNLPIAIQEMVFAVWLIRKGFSVATPPTATMRTESLAGATGRR